MQSHEDCVTFEHHIITEGEKRGEESAEDHSHTYDLRDPLPPTVASRNSSFSSAASRRTWSITAQNPKSRPASRPSYDLRDRL